MTVASIWTRLPHRRAPLHSRGVGLRQRCVLGSFRTQDDLGRQHRRQLARKSFVPASLRLAERTPALNATAWTERSPILRLPPWEGSKSWYTGGCCPPRHRFLPLPRLRSTGDPFESPAWVRQKPQVTKAARFPDTTRQRRKLYFLFPRVVDLAI